MKKHVVKWDWCCLDKLQGGLGLKDLRLQGIALASKWVVRSLEGGEPWKVLVRNNIQNAVPKHSKACKGLPLCDILISNHPMNLSRYLVFRSLWKSWEYTKHNA